MPRAAANRLLDPDVLSKMNLGQLEDLRQGAPQDVQDTVAPYAHAAFAHDVGKEGSVPAVAATAIAIPAYTAAKALGLEKSRSKASWSEMVQAYGGLWQGLRERFASGD